MRGPSGAAAELETEAIVQALEANRTYYLGQFSVQEQNESLYSVIPGQAVNRLEVEKAQPVDCYLHEETGAIITIPRGSEDE